MKLLEDTHTEDRAATVSAPARHGHLASAVLVALVLAAFAGGGVALILNIWWLFWASAAVVLISVPAGKVIGTV
jgi:hypothetical protein